MKERIAEQLLKSLSPSQKQRFWDFILSPYFNKSSQIQLLAEILMGEVDQLDENQTVDWKKVYQQLYGSQSYNAQKLNRILNKLTGRIKMFLAYEEYARQPIRQSVDLLSFYTQSHFLDSFNRDFQTAMQKINHYPQDADDLLMVNKMLHLKTEFNRQENNKVGYIENLEKNTHWYFDEYVYIRWLKRLLTMKSVRLFYKDVDIDDVIEKRVRERINNGKDENNLLIRLYHLCFLMFDQLTNDENFFELKTELYENIDQLSEQEFEDLVGFALAYCNYQWQIGGRHLHQDNFELSKILIKKGYLKRLVYIPPYQFQNFVIKGIHVKEFKWVRKFIEQYQKKLQPEYRDQYVHYCLGLLEQSQENYEKALEHYANIQQRMPLVTELAIRMSKSSIYYHLDEEPLLLTHLKSFWHFVYRHKELSETRKQSYLNFINFLKRIVDLEAQEEARALITEIDNTNNLNNKTWLLRAAKAKVGIEDK